MLSAMTKTTPLPKRDGLNAGWHWIERRPSAARAAPRCRRRGRGDRAIEQQVREQARAHRRRRRRGGIGDRACAASLCMLGDYVDTGCFGCSGNSARN